MNRKTDSKLITRDFREEHNRLRVKMKTNSKPMLYKCSTLFLEKKKKTKTVQRKRRMDGP